jgi:glycerol kinase
LKNELQLISDASETENLANSVDGNNGVYLVPAFVGLGAPYWDNEARAAIVGMGRDATKAHVVKGRARKYCLPGKRSGRFNERKRRIKLLNYVLMAVLQEIIF